MAPVPRKAADVIAILDRTPAPLTREEIGARAALSRPTVSKLISSLQEAGYVMPAEGLPANWFADAPEGPVPRPRSGPGRPALAFRLTKRAGVVIGVDMGHRGIRCAIADSGGEVLQDGDEMLAQKVDVDRLGPEALIRAVDMARTLAKRARVRDDEIRGVVIGVPAPILRTGRIASASYLPSWNRLDVLAMTRRELARRFPRHRWDERVFVENDANLGALGEAVWGTAHDRSKVLYVKVSSGIGAGLVIEDRVYRGANGLAGEFGHLSVPHSAVGVAEPAAALARHRAAVAPCARCGKPDCLEVQASGDALLRTAALRSADHEDLHAMIDKIRTDPVRYGAENADLAAAAERIGYAIAQATVLLDPEMVVVGGLMAEAGDLILDPIRRAARRYGAGFDDVPIERVKHRETVGVHGAVALALRETAPILTNGLRSPAATSAASA